MRFYAKATYTKSLMYSLGAWVHLLSDEMNEYLPPGSVQGYMLPMTRNCYNCLLPVKVLLTLQPTVNPVGHAGNLSWLSGTGKEGKAGLALIYPSRLRAIGWHFVFKGIWHGDKFMVMLTVEKMQNGV